MSPLLLALVRDWSHPAVNGGYGSPWQSTTTGRASRILREREPDTYAEDPLGGSWS